MFLTKERYRRAGAARDLGMALLVLEFATRGREMAFIVAGSAAARLCNGAGPEPRDIDTYILKKDDQSWPAGFAQVGGLLVDFVTSPQHPRRYNGASGSGR